MQDKGLFEPTGFCFSASVSYSHRLRFYLQLHARSTRWRQDETSVVGAPQIDVEASLDAARSRVCQLKVRHSDWVTEHPPSKQSHYPFFFPNEHKLSHKKHLQTHDTYFLHLHLYIYLNFIIWPVELYLPMQTCMKAYSILLTFSPVHVASTSSTIPL